MGGLLGNGSQINASRVQKVRKINGEKKVKECDSKKMREREEKYGKKM
jgi:hypothetical protein